MQTCLISQHLPCALGSSEGVHLLEDPVIQRIAEKHSKSSAQVGGGCPLGWRRTRLLTLDKLMTD